MLRILIFVFLGFLGLLAGYIFWKPALRLVVGIGHPIPMVMATAFDYSLILDHDVIVDIHNNGASGAFVIEVTQGLSKWTQRGYLVANEKGRFTITCPKIDGGKEYEVRATPQELFEK